MELQTEPPVEIGTTTVFSGLNYWADKRYATLTPGFSFRTYNIEIYTSEKIERSPCRMEDHSDCREQYHEWQGKVRTQKKRFRKGRLGSGSNPKNG